MEETGEQPIEESSPESIEERLASQFDPVSEEPEVEEQPPHEFTDPDEESPEVSAEGEEDETVEIEWEGQALSLPKGFEGVKDALLRQSDYTTKTQALAQERQALELQSEEIKQLSAEREFLNSVKAEQDQIASIQDRINQYEQLPWNEMSTDEMIRSKHQIDLLKSKQVEIGQALQAKQQSFIEERNAGMQQHLQKAQQYLRSALGKWDADVAKEVAEYAVRSGLPQGEVRALTNPVYVAAMYKAMKYDQLKSKQSEAVKQAKAAPPIVKSQASRRMPDDVKQKLNFKKQMNRAKTQREKDALIQKRLEGMF